MMDFHANIEHFMKKIMIARIAMPFIFTACQAPQQTESAATSKIRNAKQTAS